MVHRNHRNSFQRARLWIYFACAHESVVHECIDVFAQAAVTHYISATMIKVLYNIVISVSAGTVTFAGAQPPTHAHTHCWRRHFHSHRNSYKLCGAYNSQLTHRMSTENERRTSQTNEKMNVKVFDLMESVFFFLYIYLDQFYRTPML